MSERFETMHRINGAV